MIDCVCFANAENDSIPLAMPTETQSKPSTNK